MQRLTRIGHFPRIGGALGLLGIPLALGAGCGDDANVVSVATAWQVRCGTASGCPRDLTAREIVHVDGEDGHNVSCTAAGLEGDRIAVRFSAYKGSQYGIRVDNLTVARGGGLPVGANATFTVEDEDNTFRGALVPGAASPCQISTVQVENVGDDVELRAAIFCSGVANEASPDIKRDVSAPGGGNDGTPFDVIVRNCEGL